MLDLSKSNELQPIPIGGNTLNKLNLSLDEDIPKEIKQSEQIPIPVADTININNNNEDDDAEESSLKSASEQNDDEIKKV